MDKKYMMSTINKTTGSLETYDIRTGELVRSNGIALETGKIYSEEIGDAIAHLVADGSSMIRIAAMQGMPSVAVMHRWGQMYPEFRSKMQAARRYRSEQYREKAEAILGDETLSKDDVAVAKFKFDGYMRLAEKDNPDVYGNASQAISGQGMSLKLVVNTGIVRDDVVIEGVQYEEKDDEDISGLTIRGDGRDGDDRGGSRGESGAADSGDDEEQEGGYRRETSFGGEQASGNAGEPEEGKDSEADFDI